MDRHTLYECCVQKPRILAGWLRRLHSGTPRILAEDFCGTGALALEWIASDPHARAFALDIDDAVLEVARRRASDLPPQTSARITITRADALAPASPHSGNENVDIVFVGNFSIGEIKDRPALVTYLKKSRARLAPHGVFICDTYGGASAWTTGTLRRTHHVEPDAHNQAARVHYTWEQREIDAMTARVVNALHFRVEQGGEIVQEITDAFVYRWRLWSVPELRDAMLEAGFTHIETHTTIDEDSVAPATAASSYVACMVARTQI